MNTKVNVKSTVSVNSNDEILRAMPSYQDNLTAMCEEDGYNEVVDAIYHNNKKNNNNKISCVVVALGETLNDGKNVTIISVIDSTCEREMILAHMVNEVAKLGASTTSVGFSEPMEHDLALMLAEEMTRELEQLLVDSDSPFDLHDWNNKEETAHV